MVVYITKTVKTKCFPTLWEQFYDAVISGMNLVGLLLLMITAGSIFPFSAANAQSMLTGKITDAATGQAVAGARVQLDQQGFTTATDIDGRYTLRRVPQGEYMLVVNTAGYERQEVTVMVNEAVSEQDVELVRTPVEGDSIQVKQYLNKKARALSLSKPHSSVLTLSQINRFADYSVQDAMKRLPGVQASRNGEINIRGAGADRYYVMIDGQRVASTGSGNRSVDLGAISTDLISELEVIKVIRPDMDADGLAGAVNLVTQGSVPGERQLNIQLGGGANTQYFSMTGPTSRFSVNFSESLLDNLTFSASLQHQIENQSWESLLINYDTENFGSGPVDVIERVSPGIQTDERGRWGGHFQLNYEPDNRTRYHVRTMLNTENRERTSHHDFWAANGDWINQTTTGEEGEIGSQGHNAQLQETEISQLNVQAGARHLFDYADLAYTVGWSHSRSDSREYDFPFSIDVLNHAVNMDDRTRPVMEVTNFNLQEDGSISRQFILAQNFNRTVDEQIDDTFSARADLTVPFNFGELKFGSKAQIISKRADFSDSSLDLNRTYRLIRFDVLREPNRDLEVVDSDYHIPWLLDTQGARAFLESQRPTFSRDENLYHRNSDIRNFDTMENLLAAYGMSTIEFGNFKLLAGVRAEYLGGDYEGRTSVFDDAGDFVETEVNSDDNSRLDLFPHARLSFEPGNRSQVSFSYSRSIDRPGFNQLVPFERVDAQNLTLFRGNPELDPVLSDNLDLSFDHFFNNIGIVSAAAFYKQLENFIYISEQTVGSGEYSGYSEMSYQNGDETATLYGVELSLDKRLTFLPGFLGNFGIYSNYTWTESEFDAGRPDDVELPGVSPHVLNVALNYTQGRFSTQLAYHRTSVELYSLQESPEIAPAIDNSQEVYMDRYRDGLSNLSFAFKFRISEQFRFWADASNLIGGERIIYSHTRDLYPDNTQLFGGREIRLGVRFDL